MSVALGTSLRGRREGRAPAPVPVPAPASARTLRRLFLTLFLRGRTARGLQRNKAPVSVARKLRLATAGYAFFGCLALALFREPVFQFSVYLHAMTFIFLGMFVASSAGEILFNREEADILLHRPVTASALLGAKVGVLVQVSLWLAAAFNAAGLIAGGYMHGWVYPLAHTASTALEALFCTGSVVLSYQLCLRWFGRDRLERLMTTAQVLVSVAFILAAQILPRVMFRFGTVLDAQLHSWWILLLPPAWFAGLDDAAAGSRAPVSWLLGALAVLGTAAVLWAALVKLAGDYLTGLKNLGPAPPPRAASSRARPRQGGFKLVDLPPLRWWLRDPVERRVFLLVAAYLRRDRDTKLRFYPSVAPMLVVPFLMLLQSSTGQAQGLRAFPIAFAGAFLGLIPMLALDLLTYSQQWQASDLFRVTPLRGPGVLCRGARKAAICLSVPPLALLIALLGWWQGGSALALLLPGLVIMPFYAFIPCLNGRAVPLSRANEEAKSVGHGLRMLGLVLASVLIGGLALLAKRIGWFWPFLGVETAIVAVLCAVLGRHESKLDWQADE